MAKVGETFRTGQRCEASGRYVFAYYTDGTTQPAPKINERTVSLHAGDEIPRIDSVDRDAWWRLQSIAPQ